jgi:peroxiredoxin
MRKTSTAKRQPRVNYYQGKEIENQSGRFARKVMNRVRLSIIGTLVLLFVPSFAPAAQDDAANSQSWSGVIINSNCSADEAFAESAECTKRMPGGKLSLYDDNVRQIYALDPQTLATGHLEDSVTVAGTLDGNTIHVSSVQKLSSFGLDVNEKAPAFAALDQFGRAQSLETLKGTNGTVLLFFRSADWCPYCKGQLIQLQMAKARFEKQGIRLAGISYDSVEILKFFSDRRKIEFPLLSDPDSKIIRAYQVLNAEATGQNKGMSRPGYFLSIPRA